MKANKNNIYFSFKLVLTILILLSKNSNYKYVVWKAERE